MLKHFSILILAAAAFAGSGALAAVEPLIVQAAGTDYLAFQAEAAATLTADGTAQWEILTDSDADSGAALYTRGESIVVPTGLAAFQLRFSVPGNYVLYTRWKADFTIAVDSPFGANSFYYPRTFGVSPAWTRSRANERAAPESLTYDWTEENIEYTITADDVAAGKKFDFVLGTREEGLILDRLILKQGKGFTRVILDTLVDSPDASTVPEILQVLGGDGLKTVVIQFSRPIRTPSAANFLIANLDVLSVVQDPADASRVVLNTASQTLDTTYTLSFQNIASLSGAPLLPAAKATFRTALPAPGWVALIRPSEPTAWLDRFEYQGETNAAGIVELRAYFFPPASGRYAIYAKNTGPAQIALAAREDDTNLFQADLTAPTPEFDANTFFLTPFLTEGSNYVLTAQVSAGSTFALASRLSGAAGDPSSLAPLAGTNIVTVLNPHAANLRLLQHPGPVTAEAGQSIRLTVQVAADRGPIIYQWQRNGLDLPGATSPSYQTPTLSAAHSGDQYQVLIKAAGQSLLSDSALLTVLPGRLQVRSGLSVAWDAGATGALLESSLSLGADAAWTPVPGYDPITGPGSLHPSAEAARQMFFRLRTVK